MYSNLLSGGGGSGLDEVADILLEVKVVKLVVLLNLQQVGQLSIGNNGSTVGLQLQIVGLDILVEFLGDFSARHFSASGLADERSELVTDKGRLGETRRGLVAGGLLHSGRLLGKLLFLGVELLGDLHTVLDTGNQTGDLLKLGTDFVHHRRVGNDGGFNSISGGRSHINDGGNNHVDHGGNLLFLLGGSLLGLNSNRDGGSDHSGGGDNSGSGGSSSSRVLSDADHVIYLVLYSNICYVFISFIDNQ